MERNGNARRPIAITQQGSATLDVTWGDGHQSSYPLAYLRRQCLCATCRAKKEEEATAPPNPFKVLGPAPSAVPSKLEQVGQYALGVTWSDGHYSIFAFDALRELCPSVTDRPE